MLKSLAVLLAIFGCKLQMLHAISKPPRLSNSPQPTTLKQPNSVGIDLGTTYSLISVIKDSKPYLLTVDGSHLLPSVVHYDKNGKVVVGQKALESYRKDTKNTFHSVKRLIGRTIEDARLTKDDKIFGKKKLTFVPVPDHIEINCPGENICALVAPALNKTLLPEEISAEVLKYLLGHASEFLGCERIDNAVITVPAYFDPHQRAATEKAGYLAGLKKVKLLKEPEAAAMAYGLLKDTPQLVLVIDLGGGTFDVSVLEVGAGLVEVIATSGDGHLGGDDFDQVIVDWILNQSGYFTEDHVPTLKTNPRFMRHLSEVATAAKIHLSKQREVEVTFLDPLTNENATLRLTRGKFESMSQLLLARMLRPIREVAIMAGINLPGESGAQGLKETFFSSDPEKDSSGQDSDNEVDTKLLSLQQKEGRKNARVRNKMAGKVTKEVRRLQRSSADTTLTVFPGGQEIDNVILVGGASRMPCVVELVHTLTGVDPKRSVSPDEAICLGAGILAGVLDGKIEGFQVLSPLQAALLRLVTDESQKGNTALLKSLTSSTTGPDTLPVVKSSTAEKKEPLALTPSLFKTDVTSRAFSTRGSTTKIRLTTEEDADVTAYLLKQQNKSKSVKAAPTDASISEIETPASQKLPTKVRNIFRISNKKQSP